MEKENMRGRKYKEENVNISKNQSTTVLQSYHTENFNIYKVHSRRLVLIEIYLISWLKDSISERCQIFSNANKYLNVFFTELSRVDLKFKQMHKCLIMVMKILEQRKVGDKWREIAVLGNQICYKAIVI